MIKKISRESLEASLRDTAPPILVEALPESYYADGHLPGAVRINCGEAAEKAPALLKDKSARVVVYCANAACSNSEKLAQELVAMGYTSVETYHEGKKDWSEAGLPLERA